MNILFALLVLLPLVELAEDNKYCKCNPLHVLCDKGNYNPTKKLIKDSEPLMQPAYQKAVVENLNFLRHAVASGASIFPHASNMKKLVYSEQLQRAAEMQVVNCNPWTGFNKTEEWCKHDCYKCTDIDGLEVHFSKTFNRRQTQHDRFCTVLSEIMKPPKTFIFDTSDNYKTPNITKIPDELSEIQYMALQADYAEVGCSHTTYVESENDDRLYTMVCAFGPVTPGMTDRPPYKVGTQCCNCPTDTKCTDPEKTSLCIYEEGKSYNKTAGIAENGKFCTDPNPSKKSVKETLVSEGGGDNSKKTIVLSDQSKGNDTHEGTGKKKGCKIFNVILPS